MTNEELEELAKKFIVDYVPYSENQSQIVDSIRNMEVERSRLLNKLKRYDAIIKALYLELSGEGEE